MVHCLEIRSDAMNLLDNSKHTYVTTLIAIEAEGLLKKNSTWVLTYSKYNWVDSWWRLLEYLMMWCDQSFLEKKIFFNEPSWRFIQIRLI